VLSFKAFSVDIICSYVVNDINNFIFRPRVRTTNPYW
jgi:hypothetical protein